MTLQLAEDLPASEHADQQLATSRRGGRQLHPATFDEVQAIGGPALPEDRLAPPVPKGLEFARERTEISGVQHREQRGVGQKVHTVLDRLPLTLANDGRRLLTIRHWRPPVIHHRPSIRVH